MRIALVSQEYPPETAKGGIGSQTYAKAHGLASLGHEVEVISRTPGTVPSERMDHQVRVMRVPGFEARMAVYSPSADWVTYSAEVSVALAARHSIRPFDLVDFPEWGAEGYVHLLNQSEWNRIPTVLHLHGPLVMFAHTLGWPALDSLFYRVGSAMEGICLRLADAVISSSRCSAEWCARHYFLDAGSTPILHTGVSTSMFQPGVAAKAKRPTIVFAGKLEVNKGVKLLVEAACALAKEFPDLHLRLLGRGEEKMQQELRAMAQAKGFPELLDLPGFISREELPSHLCRAHLFAAPSQYEGGPGFVYLEAMACGLPVIACSGSGAAEVVQAGETGFLVPPQNLEALVEALRMLLSDPAKRQVMGEKARQFVLDEADSAICLRRLEAFYLAVISGRATHRIS